MNPNAGPPTLVEQGAFEAFLHTIFSYDDEVWYRLNIHNDSIAVRECNWAGEPPQSGDVWMIEGSFLENATSGSEFVISSGKLTIPTGSLMPLYMMRHCCPVTAELCRSLWHDYGPELKFMLEGGIPSRLLKDCSGISDLFWKRICRQWRTQVELVRQITSFSAIGIDRIIAQKAFDLYGEVAYDYIAEDPCRLTPLIGFEAANRIAAKSFAQHPDDGPPISDRAGGLLRELATRAPSASEPASGGRVYIHGRNATQYKTQDSSLTSGDQKLRSHHRNAADDGLESAREQTRHRDNPSALRLPHLLVADSASRRGLEALSRLIRRADRHDIDIVIATRSPDRKRLLSDRFGRPAVCLEELFRSALSPHERRMLLIDAPDTITASWIADLSAVASRNDIVILINNAYSPNLAHYDAISPRPSLKHVWRNSPATSDGTDVSAKPPPDNECPEPARFSGRDLTSGWSQVEAAQEQVPLVALNILLRLKSTGITVIVSPTRHLADILDTRMREIATIVGASAELQVGDTIVRDYASATCPVSTDQIGLITEVYSPPVHADSLSTYETRPAECVVRFGKDEYPLCSGETDSIRRRYVTTIEMLPELYPENLIAVVDDEGNLDSEWVFSCCSRSGARLITVGSSSDLARFGLILKGIQSYMVLPDKFVRPR